ncbi:hypothetical protein, partial [Klebsiella pneumoniae]|uniref:hypothetical protein n=1 Tax=Klebsiella pneumoniae TaxID=573 RepID=UPI0038BDD266
QNDVTLKMPAFEWVHVQLHQQKGMISLSPPTICNSAHDALSGTAHDTRVVGRQQPPGAKRGGGNKYQNAEGKERTRRESHYGFQGHCCKVSDEAAFCLIQRPYISKTLLTRRISPRGSP